MNSYTAKIVSSLGFDMSLIDSEQIGVLEAGLSPLAYKILREHGTQAAFCGGFEDQESDGDYVCGFCALPLFRSKDKFHSRSGWPSFTDPIALDHVTYIEDNSHGMKRVEIRCARCDSHLGHVFPDGPKASVSRPSYDRYCLNSVALGFVAQGEKLPNVLGRNDPQSLAWD